MAVLKLWESGSANGNPSYEGILAVEAEEGVTIGRPTIDPEYSHVVSIPGCGPNAGILGVSREHARISWNPENGFMIEPHRGKVRLDALENVIQEPSILETGSLIYFGPISVWAEIID
ncbi:MAG: hypothetical protein U9M98_02685 [Patescibacteria group bacterium]|nr:hypothetical protein [Patescibacteria group bacterium]